METPSAVAETADRLHSAAIHLLRQLREEDIADGIGPAQLSALSVLVFGGPRTIGALAQTEQVAAPTMTRIVDALVTGGFVRREVDPADKRSFLVVATSQGLRLMRDGRRRRVKRLAAALEALPPDEVATIAAAAGMISAMLQKSAQVPAPPAGSKPRKA